MSGAARGPRAAQDSPKKRSRVRSISYTPPLTMAGKSKAAAAPKVPSVRTVQYDDIEASLATGDVLLFHGASGVSLTIESKTQSPFSHAAMVIRPDRDSPPLVWQADPIPL